jgi:hypothetical protein
MKYLYMVLPVQHSMLGSFSCIEQVTFSDLFALSLIIFIGKMVLPLEQRRRDPP